MHRQHSYCFFAFLLSTAVAAAQTTPVTTVVHPFPQTVPPGSTLGYYPDGQTPQGPLLLASDGNYYGTTQDGGYDGQCTGDRTTHLCAGTVFKLTPAGQFTVLHTFAWGGITAQYFDGAQPNGGLVEGPDGFLYGTTVYGGNGGQTTPTFGAGVVFRISKTGDFTVLHRFCMDSACTEGKFVSALVLGRDGKFYATARDGAPSKGGRDGTVFRVDTSGNVETLHYMVALVDGATPLGPLIQASDCNFYGVNSISGPSPTSSDQGTIFRITPTGDFKVIYEFKVGGPDAPSGDLIQASNGKLYGIAKNGGVYRTGVIWEVGLDGSYREVFDLQQEQRTNGAIHLIEASDGNLWWGAFSASNLSLNAVSLDGKLVRNIAPTCAQTTSGGSVGALFQSPDGKLWVTADRGPCQQTKPGGALITVDAGLPKLTNPIIGSVTNGGSFARGSIVPGEISTVFGTNLTGATGINLAPSVPLPTSMLNTTILVNGCAATPLFAVDNVNGNQQINFQVPWEVAGQQTVAVQVVNGGGVSPAVGVPVQGTQPGVFNYNVGTTTFGAILHADYSLADSAHPAAGGETVLIYLTGMGLASTPQLDGNAANGENTVAMPLVTIGGQPAMVAYSGLAPGFVGLNQINVQIPSGIASGNQPVVVNVGDGASNTVMLPVK